MQNKHKNVYCPVKLNIFDLLPHYITNHTQDGRKYQAYLINELTTDDIHVIDVI